MLAACNVLKTHLSDSKAVSSKDLVRGFFFDCFGLALPIVVLLYLMNLRNNILKRFFMEMTLNWTDVHKLSLCNNCL